MILDKLSIVNYRNIAMAELDLSAKLNCFVGCNGAGKTNVLDAVAYLSMCRSTLTPTDAQVIRRGTDFFMVSGDYRSDGGEPETVSCSLKAGARKRLRRNQKEYRRLSEHLGVVPMVMVAPQDTLLIDGPGEERRRLMDMVIAQYDRPYVEALARYNKALQQRNAMLKADEEPDGELMAILEEQMGQWGEAVAEARGQFVTMLEPLFQRYYDAIAEGRETVGVAYVSHCQRGPLVDVIRRDRHKDRAVGYSLHGIHRDELELTLQQQPMRRYASQGQAKSFVVALKLAQFDFLKRASGGERPLLLLDDIFDKLDAERVSQLVKLVAGDGFGQIFITDTDAQRMGAVAEASGGNYRIFAVDKGEVTRINGNNRLT